MRCKERVLLARRQDEVKEGVRSMDSASMRHSQRAPENADCSLSRPRPPLGAARLPFIIFCSLRSTYSATRWVCSPASGHLTSSDNMMICLHEAARGSYCFASRALSAQAQRRVPRVTHVTAPRRGGSGLRPPTYAAAGDSSAPPWNLSLTHKHTQRRGHLDRPTPL